MKNIFYIKKDNDFQKIKRVFKIVMLRGNQSHLIVRNKNIKSLKHTVLIIIILLSLECGH